MSLKKCLIYFHDWPRSFQMTLSPSHGKVVSRKGCQSLSYIIREILLHGNLTHITLVLHPLEPCHDLNGTPQWKTSISSKSFESDVCVAKLMGELVVVELEDVIPDQV